MPQPSARKSIRPKTKSVKKPKNARGRRQSHAARLVGEMVVVREVAKPARRERGSDVRDRVLQASLECFGAFGFAGTSTRAVAERAGVSHPLLLYHFQSKDQLWQSTMDDLLGRYQAALSERLERISADDAVAGVRAFIENFVAFSAQTPQLHRIMTQQSTQGSDRIRWVVDTHLRESFNRICDRIRRGQREGTICPGDPARLYYAVIGLGGTLFSVSSEFALLTKRDVFAGRELKLTTEMIFDFLFKKRPA